jgi:hypothetical protein
MIIGVGPTEIRVMQALMAKYFVFERLGSDFAMKIAS